MFLDFLFLWAWVSYNEPWCLYSFPSEEDDDEDEEDDDDDETPVDVEDDEPMRGLFGAVCFASIFSLFANSKIYFSTAILVPVVATVELK
jgi:hypothetical protein